MRHKITLIVNPVSGTVDKNVIAEEVERRLTNAGHYVTLRFTGCKGDASRIAREEAAHGTPWVVAVGGDGTVNEVASSLCETGTALGIIPCGSGNGLARHLNIPVDVDGAIRVLLAGHEKAIDYCTMNGEKFFCTFGIGFDAAVTHNFARQGHRGPITYVKSALSEYLKYHPAVYTISVDNKELTKKAFIVAACNASQYGNNAYIAPEAIIDDGYLDLIIVHVGNPITRAFMGFDLFTGTIDKNALIESFKVNEAVIRCDCDTPVPVHIDGEPREVSQEINLACHHAGLKVIAPSKEDNFKPIITPVSNLMKDTGIAIKNLFHPLGGQEQR